MNTENNETEPTAAKISKMDSCSTKWKPTDYMDSASTASSASTGNPNSCSTKWNPTDYTDSASTASSASTNNPVTINNYHNCTITISKQ